MPVPDQRGLGDHQRHGLALHVGAHERAVGVVVLQERDEGGGDRDDLLRGDVHVVDVDSGPGHDRLAALAGTGRGRRGLPLRVDLGVGLGDDLVLLRRWRRGADLVGDLALDHLAVRGLDEPVLVDRRVAAQRADEADVRPLGGLDGAHAPVVGGVHVAHLDGGALAGQPAGAERRQAAAVGEAGQRVGLVHELRELRGAEELLERRHHGPDVDDRLRGDGVDVLGAHALAHDALHAVEADAEGLLDELAHGAQPAVAEVLVLVELVSRSRRAGAAAASAAKSLESSGTPRRIGRSTSRLDELAPGRRPCPAGPSRGEPGAGERADAARHVDAEAGVELVAADLGQVVALGVEEQRAHEGLASCPPSAARPGAAS